MEEIGTTIPKYQPLQVLWCSLYDYARQTILSHTIRSLPKHQHLHCNLKFIKLGSETLLIRPYKVLPFTTKILCGRHFFFLLYFFPSFSLHTFHGLAGASVNPGSFSNSLFVHSLLCLTTHLFLHGS